jgi:ethanolamine utilization protein EutN
MDIHQVVGTLVCTQRVTGLHHVSLRVLRDGMGKLNVATDPVGARSGNWVFTTSGSAARLAMGDTRILTDLTIGGIIDHWDVPETETETETESRTEAGAGDQRPADAA